MPSPPGRVGRARRRLAAGVGVVCAALALLYALTPWLAARLAPLLAAPLGLDSLELRIGHPGFRSIRVASVALASGRFRVEGFDGRLGYGAGLLGGRLDRVSFERLALTVTETGSATAAGVDEPGPAATPEVLFAALPAAVIEIDELALTVPALAFSASGPVRISPQAVELQLQAHAPPQAARFSLAARLARDGALNVRLAEDGAAATPFLTLASALEPTRLALQGEMQLHGFVLDLAVALAGLPAGDGSVSGSFTGSLPWPLPEPLDWRVLAPALALEGDAAVDWRPAAGSWQIDAASARWRVDGGTLQATAEVPLRYAGQTWQVQASVAALTADPAGSGEIVLAAATGADPYGRLGWQLGPAGLALDGAFSVRDGALTLARSLVSLPDGDGVLQLTARTQLPWPLPDLSRLRPDAEGTLGGRWQLPDAALQVSLVDASWQLRDGRLAGSAAARIGFRGFESRLGLALSRAELRGDAVSAQGSIRLGDLEDLPFAVTQRLDGSAGTLRLDGRIAVNRALAAGLLDGWSAPYDITAGNVSVAAALRWPRLPALPEGSARLALDGLAAHYDEYRVAGLSGELTFTGEGGRWRLQPAPLRAARVATGVPVEALETSVAWSDDTVQVGASSARLLGGSAQVTPFAYSLTDGSGSFVVALADLSLAEILALEGEQVSGTGTLHGSLPVTLTDNAPGVSDGRVEAEPPGGVIRVASSLAGGTGQPGLDFALRALQDFRYDVLRAGVSYSAQGDMKLDVHLEGRNPEIEKGRPIHYNLAVSENLPVLLKSLRLESDVTRGIERRLNN